MDNVAKNNESKDSRAIQTSLVAKTFDYLGIYIGVIILALWGLKLDANFLSQQYLLEMFAAEAQFLAIAITGAYFITYGGKMADLSIPCIMATAGFATIACLDVVGFYPALIIGVFAGSVIGLINGLCIGYLRVNPIIWTLAMNFIIDGVLRWFFKGRQIYPQNELFLAINENHISFYIIIFLIAFFLILSKATSFGHSVLMVGASEKVSKASGVNNGKVITAMFFISSITSAIAGICYCSSAKLATFETGLRYDFKVVTAIVLGGVTLQGGKGYLHGALGGLIFITFLENVMVLSNIQYYDREIIKGIMFICVVALGIHFAKKSGQHV
jgi:ribose/xylose/arabinose/galactoside ABC-type transport system permease subunit